MVNDLFDFFTLAERQGFRVHRTGFFDTGIKARRKGFKATPMDFLILVIAQGMLAAFALLSARGVV